MVKSKLEFTDVKFMSADKKRLVFNQWCAFLKSGCARDKFTKGLYDHLIQNCDFIAHYDLAGFYADYFLAGADTLHFLSQFDAGLVGPGMVPPSIEYGMTAWACDSDYIDLNMAMIRYATVVVRTLRPVLKESQRQDDIDAANHLVAKYGLKVTVSV